MRGRRPTGVSGSGRRKSWQLGTTISPVAGKHASSVLCRRPFSTRAGMRVGSCAKSLFRITSGFHPLSGHWSLHIWTKSTSPSLLRLVVPHKSANPISPSLRRVASYRAGRAIEREMNHSRKVQQKPSPRRRLDSPRGRVKCDRVDLCGTTSHCAGGCCDSPHANNSITPRPPREGREPPLPPVALPSPSSNYSQHRHWRR